VGAHKLTLTKETTFNGKTGFTDTTLNLGEQDLIMKGGDATFNGASTIKTTVAGAGAGLNLGNLVAGDGSTIILAGANTLKIEVDDKAVLPVNGQNLKLIAKAGNGVLQGDPAKVTVTATGTFSKWTPSVVNGEFVLTQISQIQEVISAAIEEAGLSYVISEDGAQAIEDYEEGTAGEDFALQLNQMTKPNIADATARLTNTNSNEVSEVNLELLNEVTNIISGRVSDMANFVGSSFNPAASNATKSTNVSSENSYISGIAAGDENDRFGVWATPFYSKSTQKKRSGTSGFKADSYGGTFGADTRVNDNMHLGAAFTAMNTDIKHKDFKSGDKTKVSSYLLSIYGLHQFNNNWFGQGVVSIGSSSVNNKENRRVSNTQLAIAEGKYSSMTFAAEVLSGYNHMVNDQLVVTPMFGFNYNRINDGSYNESGDAAVPQLMEVTKKASQKLDIVGGIKLETKPIMLNGVAISPEAHAFVRHDVIGKGTKVNAKIAGLSLLPSEKAKLQKTFYEIGAGLDASYGSMDYGISADATFAKKYVGVQGALKLRVNF
jgi:outer membrane autotransporter protein